MRREMAGGQHEQTGFTPDQVVKGVSSTICIAVPSLRCKSVHPLVLEPEAIVGRVEGSSSSGSNSNAHRSRRVHTWRAEAIMWERAQTDTALLHDMYTSGSVRPAPPALKATTQIEVSDMRNKFKC